MVDAQHSELPLHSSFNPSAGIRASWTSCTVRTRGVRGPHVSIPLQGFVLLGPDTACTIPIYCHPGFNPSAGIRASWTDRLKKGTKVWYLVSIPLQGFVLLGHSTNVSGDISGWSLGFNPSAGIRASWTMTEVEAATLGRIVSIPLQGFVLLGP